MPILNLDNYYRVVKYNAGHSSRFEYVDLYFAVVILALMSSSGLSDVLPRFVSFINELL